MTMRNLETVFTFHAMLIAVYKEVMDASEVARGTDFTVEKEVLARKFRSNILKSFFYILSDFLVTRSAQAMEMGRSGTRSRLSSPKRKARVSNLTGEQECESIPTNELTSISQSSQFNFTSENTPATPVGSKRVFSNESHGSYGPESTETTPIKSATQNQSLNPYKTLSSE